MLAEERHGPNQPLTGHSGPFLCWIMLCAVQKTQMKCAHADTVKLCYLHPSLPGARGLFGSWNCENDGISHSETESNCQLPSVARWWQQETGTWVENLKAAPIFLVSKRGHERVRVIETAQQRSHPRGIASPLMWRASHSGVELQCG